MATSKAEAAKAEAADRFRKAKAELEVAQAAHLDAHNKLEDAMKRTAVAQEEHDGALAALGAVL